MNLRRTWGCCEATFLARMLALVRSRSESLPACISVPNTLLVIMSAYVDVWMDGFMDVWMNEWLSRNMDE